MGATSSTAPVLVIGCGNLLRGDDAAGPLVVRSMAALGTPAHLDLFDAGTAAAAAAVAMRGRDTVVLVDAARTGRAPGTIVRIPGNVIERLAPSPAPSAHTVRWDHLLAFARWLLGDAYPRHVVALLVEAESVEPGASPTPAVTAAVEDVVQLITRIVDEQVDEEAVLTEAAATPAWIAS